MDGGAAASGERVATAEEFATELAAAEGVVEAAAGAERVKLVMRPGAEVGSGNDNDIIGVSVDGHVYAVSLQWGQSYPSRAAAEAAVHGFRKASRASARRRSKQAGVKDRGGNYDLVAYLALGDGAWTTALGSTSEGCRVGMRSLAGAVAARVPVVGRAFVVLELPTEPVVWYALAVADGRPDLRTDLCLLDSERVASLWAELSGEWSGRVAPLAAGVATPAAGTPASQAVAGDLPPEVAAAVLGAPVGGVLEANVPEANVPESLPPYVAIAPGGLLDVEGHPFVAMDWASFWALPVRTDLAKATRPGLAVGVPRLGRLAAAGRAVRRYFRYAIAVAYVVGVVYGMGEAAQRVRVYFVQQELEGVHAQLRAADDALRRALAAGSGPQASFGPFPPAPWEAGADVGARARWAVEPQPEGARPDGYVAPASDAVGTDPNVRVRRVAACVAGVREYPQGRALARYGPAGLRRWRLAEVRCRDGAVDAAGCLLSLGPPSQGGAWGVCVGGDAGFDGGAPGPWRLPVRGLPAPVRSLDATIPPGVASRWDLDAGAWLRAWRAGAGEAPFRPLALGLADGSEGPLAVGDRGGEYGTVGWDRLEAAVRGLAAGGAIFVGPGQPTPPSGPAEPGWSRYRHAPTLTLGLSAVGRDPAGGLGWAAWDWEWRSRRSPVADAAFLGALAATPGAMVTEVVWVPAGGAAVAEAMRSGGPGPAERGIGGNPAGGATDGLALLGAWVVRGYVAGVWPAFGSDRWAAAERALVAECRRGARDHWADLGLLGGLRRDDGPDLASRLDPFPCRG